MEIAFARDALAAAKPEFRFSHVRCAMTHNSNDQKALEANAKLDLDMCCSWLPRWSEWIQNPGAIKTLAKGCIHHVSESSERLSEIQPW
jgi:hypothetical protein